MLSPSLTSYFNFLAHSLPLSPAIYIFFIRLFHLSLSLCLISPSFPITHFPVYCFVPFPPPTIHPHSFILSSPQPHSILLSPILCILSHALLLSSILTILFLLSFPSLPSFHLPFSIAFSFIFLLIISPHFANFSSFSFSLPSLFTPLSYLFYLISPLHLLFLFLPFYHPFLRFLPFIFFLILSLISSPQICSLSSSSFLSALSSPSLQDLPSLPLSHFLPIFISLSSSLSLFLFISHPLFMISLLFLSFFPFLPPSPSFLSALSLPYLKDLLSLPLSHFFLIFLCLSSSVSFSFIFALSPPSFYDVSPLFIVPFLSSFLFPSFFISHPLLFTISLFSLSFFSFLPTSPLPFYLSSPSLYNLSPLFIFPFLPSSLSPSFLSPSSLYDPSPLFIFLSFPSPFPILSSPFPRFFPLKFSVDPSVLPSAFPSARHANRYNMRRSFLTLKETLP
ncbi:hypothetical protein C7M84_007638, partial [Penaeus vannamei]